MNTGNGTGPKATVTARSMHYVNTKFHKPKSYRRRNMKKVFMIVLAVLISAAFVTSGFAQAPAAKPATDNPAAAAPAPAPEKAVPAPAPEKKAEKKGTTKAKVHQYTGEVVSMDAAAKTAVVKGEKGDMTFDIATAKMKGEAKAGDKVVVKYTEKDGKMVASSVAMAPGKNAPAKPAAEKPAAKPAAEKAPAPAPAPAK